MSERAVPGDTIVITDESSVHKGHELIVTECHCVDKCKCNLEIEATWFFDKILGHLVWTHPGTYRIVKRYRQNESTKMKWLNVRTTIPAPSKNQDVIGSDDVLCQDINGCTFVGFVTYGKEKNFWWMRRDQQSHRYVLMNIVKWIPLREVLEQISMSDGDNHGEKT